MEESIEERGPSGEGEGVRTTHTFCRICESLCGLEIDQDVDGGILAVRPDTQHVETDGFACVKGLKQQLMN